MSKIPSIPKGAIAVGCAIVGANLVAIFTQHPNPVRSTECFQPFQQVGESFNAAADRLRSQPEPRRSSSEPRTDIPFYENDPWANAPVRSAAAATPHPAQPVPRDGFVSVAPATAPLSMTDAEIDAAIARERSESAAPGAQIGSTCEVGADGRTYCGAG